MISFLKNTKLLFLLVAGVFCVLLYKNIQYPLLWNDEADTVMYGRSILTFGYPKVHDGKNTILHFTIGKPSLPVREKTDIYVGNVWGQYYFMAPFVKIADYFGNFYTKTAILRVPFATAGLLGLLIFGFSVLPVFKNNIKRKFRFLFLFILLESTSVYLLLHLRQVRAHTLNVMLLSLVVYFYLRYNIFKSISTKVYLAVQVVLLFFLFNTYYPGYVAFTITLAILEIWLVAEKFRKNRKIDFEKLIRNTNLFVVAISSLTTLPIIFYFKMPEISSEITRITHFNMFNYLENIIAVLYFFLAYEVLYLVGATKLLLLIIKPSTVIKLANKETGGISNYLTLFSLIYLLIAAYNPLFYFRYMLVLQPLLAIIFLLDLSLLWSTINQNRKTGLVVILGAGLIVLLFNRGLLFKNYLSEITNQYRGPLDYAIPYIKNKYNNTNKLVIATNYEEQSLMYYLGSKVVIGFTGNNLEEDIKYKPDIIIPRKKYLKNYLKEIYDLIDQGGYLKSSFEVYDYEVNNIPELLYKPTHLFITKYASSDAEKLDIYEQK